MNLDFRVDISETIIRQPTKMGPIMKHPTFHILSIVAIVALLTTGCYTQVKTVYNDSGVMAPRVSDRAAVEQA